MGKGFSSRQEPQTFKPVRITGFISLPSISILEGQNFTVFFSSMAQLPMEVVGSSSLEVFQNHGDVALRDVVS